MSDRTNTLRDWFEKVRAISRADQEGWLKANCDDPHMVSEVQELLRFDCDDHFLESPLVAPLDREATHSYRPAMPSGSSSFTKRYKLLQPIGEGGFGIVYMAEQIEPVRRRVAIKLLRSNLDSKSVNARFESERQALAMMDHPNIARVYDGGVTEGGSPYFVMELVNGVPITEFCDANQLSNADRMKLLITVCQAVQHAHQKGIIHRDLKPSNILVSLLDGTPIPKVIDFGIAKALHGPLTDKTLFTSFQQMIGTPEYMSPEQAETSILDADTRSDVFSLGVLAYELLTGTTPFDSRLLRKLAFAEIQRTIREVDPPRPSDRVSTLGEQGASIAIKHGISPTSMHKAIRGDLDWIVMKAMEKDRNRRYGSAQSLAEDVRRWLENEPVEARPPSNVYRTVKLVRKHRTKVAIGMIMIIATILSAIGLGFGLSERSASLERQRQTKLQNEQLKELAEIEADSNRQLRYGNAMIAANESFRAGRRETTLELLAECPEDKRGIEWHWLSYLADDRTKTLLQGTKERTQNTLAYSAQEHWLYSAGSDGMLRLWNSDTDREQQSWRICDESIVALQVATTASLCLIVTQSGHVILWDLITGQLKSKTNEPLSGAKLAALSISHSNQIYCAVGCENGAIYIWSSGLQEPPIRLENQRKPFHGAIQSLQFYPDGSKLLAAGKGGVALFNVASGEVMSQYGQSWTSYSSQYAESLDCIALFGPPVGTLDINTLEQQKWIDVPATGIQAGAYVSQEKAIIVATQDQCLRRIHLESGHQETLGYYHGGNIVKLASAHDGHSLAIIDDSGALKILHRDAFACPKSLAAFDCEVASVIADEERVFALSDRGEIVFWDPRREVEVKRQVGHFDQGFSLTLGAREKRLVSNGIDRRLVVWSAETCDHLAEYDLAWGARYIAMHPDGKHLAGPMPRDLPSMVDTSFDLTSASQSNLAYWNLETGRVERTFNGLSNWAMKLSFSGSGSMLAAATISDGVVVWRHGVDEPIRLVETIQPQVDDVTFSADDHFLLAAYHNGQIIVWDLETLALVRRMICHGDQISGLVMTSDDSRIVTSSRSDPILRVWDWRTGQKTAEIDSGLTGVTDLTLTDNDQSLVIGGLDGRIKILRVQ